MNEISNCTYHLPPMSKSLQKNHDDLLGRLDRKITPYLVLGTLAAGAVSTAHYVTFIPIVVASPVTYIAVGLALAVLFIVQVRRYSCTNIIQTLASKKITPENIKDVAEQLTNAQMLSKHKAYSRYLLMALTDLTGAIFVFHMNTFETEEAFNKAQSELLYRASKFSKLDITFENRANWRVNGTELNADNLRLT